MARSDDGQVIRLEDWRPTDFLVRHVDMRFDLAEGGTEVVAELRMERREGASADAALVLDGDGLELASLHLDGEALAPERFEATPDRLSVNGLPAAGTPFALRIATRLRPHENTQLMGLYRSNGTWCTQCEAEGFRRITYFLDRPDVLATFRVRLEAPRALAPVLLANGNPAERGELEGGRHFAVWDDPFPKPSYLFAVVAGDLDVLRGGFRTASGRAVDLAIWTDKGMSGRAAYAMDAIQRSMLWDERRFGREYDLDVFNVVAIADFNMGAMENKGLNVFNHKYVLLDPDTATDADYAGVETVIAHEYFHNWTGNRITCRDWFQLCLKEGLTVYRDQEFTADERSRPVKRISVVHGLKSHQFPEDGGPLQHPVRPTRYREINNFYTATVYEKGSELVRMIATILGEAGFRAGMDLYFERHDGDAATVEDFLRSFEDAAGADLSQFALWYGQAGTPTLRVEESYDGERLTLRLHQSLERGAAGTGTEPLHMPIRLGLVGPDGADLPLEPVAGGAEIEDGVVHLVTRSAELVFETGGVRPLVSVLRDFSAPVSLRFDQSRGDRLALARLDPDPFGRWQALDELKGEALRAAGAASDGGTARPFDDGVVGAIVEVAGDRRLDPALRAQMAALPGEGEIARLVASEVDPERVHAAREAALAQVARAGASPFAALWDELDDTGRPFAADGASVGRRTLRNALLPYLARAEGSPARAAAAFARAGNMTDRLAALATLAHRFPDAAETRDALGAFRGRFEGDALVMDKWFALLATVPDPGAVERVRALMDDPLFRLDNPNRVRALIGGLASGNPRAFGRADGEGYRLVAETLAALDAVNAQTAARLATAFRAWRSFEPRRRSAAEAALRTLASRARSRDLADIVGRILA